MGRYITRKTVDINGGNIDGTVIGANSAASGTFTTGTFTSITETSSREIKDNIEPLTDSLEKILALDGVKYDRISSGKRESGFIAEEVEKILPELVEGEGENRSISYSRLTAYLVEAIKSLKTDLNNHQK